MKAISLCLIFSFFLSLQWGISQDIFPGSTTGAPELLLNAPGGVQASDGDYDTHVLISWNKLPGASAYQVYRSEEESSTEAELIKGWKKEPWAADYKAVPGKTYYYRVKARLNNGSITGLSQPDDGYIRKPIPYANDESLLSMETDVYATPRKILEISLFESRDTVLRQGDVFSVTYGLSNVGTTRLENINILFYLSDDPILSWGDSPLGEKVMSWVDVMQSSRNDRKLVLPERLDPGTYYLLLVASPNNMVLSSSVEVIEIRVE